jgi:hypothetical protein
MIEGGFNPGIRGPENDYGDIYMIPLGQARKRRWNRAYYAGSILLTFRGVRFEGKCKPGKNRIC